MNRRSRSTRHCRQSRGGRRCLVRRRRAPCWAVGDDAWFDRWGRRVGRHETMLGSTAEGAVGCACSAQGMGAGRDCRFPSEDVHEGIVWGIVCGERRHVWLGPGRRQQRPCLGTPLALRVGACARALSIIHLIIETVLAAQHGARLYISSSRPSSPPNTAPRPPPSAIACKAEGEASSDSQDRSL